MILGMALLSLAIIGIMFYAVIREYLYCKKLIAETKCFEMLTKEIESNLNERG